MLGAVQRGSDELRHARVQDHQARRAVGPGPLPDMEHPADQPAARRDHGPPGLDGQPPRAGIRGECRYLVRGRGGEHLRTRHGTLDAVVDREARADVQGVEVGQRGPLQGQQPQSRPAPPSAMRRRRPAATRCAGGCPASAAAHPAPPPASMSSGSSSAQDAELGPGSPDRQPAMGLRLDLGVDAHQDIERTRPRVRPAEPAPAPHPRTRGSPTAGARRSSPARPPRRSSAPPLPMPSSAMRARLEPRPPGQGQLAGRDGRRAETRRRQPSDECRAARWP